MKKYLYLLFWAVITLQLSACATLRPTARYVSEPDYNMRVRVEEPRFKKSPNVIGISVGVALPVAGAVGGYYSGLVQDYKPEEGRVASPSRGAILGGLVGVGFSALSAAVAKYGTLTNGDGQSWAKKAGPYILLRKEGDNLILIDRAAEDTYEIRNLQDVRDFAQAFPRSRRAESVIDQALAKLPREGLLEVERLFPGSPSLGKLAQRYVDSSRSFAELDEAFQRYPNGQLDKEKLYFDRIGNARDALRFRQMFPSSKRLRQAVVKAFAVDNATDVLTSMAKAYGKDFTLSASDLSGAATSVKKNYYNGMARISGFRDMAQLNRFNDEYRWLTYPNKRDDVLETAWNVAQRIGRKGTDVITQLGTVVGTRTARDVGIDASVLRSFVDNKLKDIVKDQVKIVSVKVISSTSDEFQRWKKAQYAGGLVALTELSYLVYGELRNDSKFDLPLSISVGGDIFQNVQIEKTGLGSYLSRMGSLLGVGGDFGDKRQIGHLTASNFSIPVLKSGEKGIYAALAVLSEKNMKELNRKGMGAGGGNFGDFIKMSSSLTFENPSVELKLSDHLPTSAEIKQQNELQALAKNGLPGSTLIDYARNIQYRQDTWDRRWEEIKRRAAENSASSGSSSSSSSSSRSSDSSSSTSYSEKLPEGMNMHSCRVQIYFKDGAEAGDTLYDHKITAYWGSKALFGTLYHADFETDGNGWVTISWPADEGDEIIEIFFVKGFYRDGYSIQPLHLKPGSTHRINADSYINK